MPPRQVVHPQYNQESEHRETRFRCEEPVLAHANRCELNGMVELARFFMCPDGADPASDSYVKAVEQATTPERDFVVFVVSAKDETSTKGFQDWAASERSTLPAVFTNDCSQGRNTARELVPAVPACRRQRKAV